MRYDTSKAAYEEANTKIRYVERVKQTLCTFLDKTTDYHTSRMLVSVSDYQHALSCIREVIDEMFYEEISEASKVKQAYESEDWLRYVRENKLVE